MRAAILSSAVPHVDTLLLALLRDAGRPGRSTAPGGDRRAALERRRVSQTDRAPIELITRTIAVPAGRGVDTPPGSSPTLAGLLDARDHASQLARSRPRQTVRWVWSAAHRVVADESAAEAERIAAAQLIGYSARRKQPRIATCLSDCCGLRSRSASSKPPSPPWRRTNDPKLADLLLVDWKTYSPSIRDAILDTLLSRTEWTSSLLSSLEDGCVPPAEIDPARRQQLLTRRSAQLRVPCRGRLRPSRQTAAGGRRRLSLGARDQAETGPPARPFSRSCAPRAIAWATKGSRSDPTSPA